MVIGPLGDDADSNGDDFSSKRQKIEPRVKSKKRKGRTTRRKDTTVEIPSEVLIVNE